MFQNNFTLEKIFNFIKSEKKYNKLTLTSINDITKLILLNEFFKTGKKIIFVTWQISTGYRFFVRRYLFSPNSSMISQFHQALISVPAVRFCPDPCASISLSGIARFPAGIDLTYFRLSHWSQMT